MDFEFITINGFTIETILNYSNKRAPPKYIYYVLKLSNDTIYKLAARFNIYLYNLKHKVQLLYILDHITIP